MKQCYVLLAQLDIKSLIMNTKVAPKEPLNNCKKKSVDIKASRPKKVRNNGKIPTIVEQLSQKFNTEYVPPKISELSQVNFFFNKAEVKFEWSAPTFNDIPGEKIRRLMEKRQQSLQAIRDEESEFIASTRLASNVKPTQAIETESTQNYNPQKMYQGKTEGIPFELINQLPEVAFLGRCNSGKSTLLNNLTTEVTKNNLDEYANASKKAGFTKTINCFNVGRRFRIIDTPGYGTKGTVEQGKVTMDYLLKRRELRRSFLLISANQGFSEYDAQMIDLLVGDGIPFEIVFTKMDTIKEMAQVERVIEESNVLQLPTSPRFIFLNSVTNKQCQKRSGIEILRYVIFEACGLAPGMKPSKLKK
ncbi:unnamed protein product [Kluyveromyces dobzhanskii CBS 2104]|uniref:WGS project CCBQ000000000 data, contig 00058 n=1 Tax=Kluyveromyces dobzhanskii CBS 2104 TaxID=1427455 RepID=A0A0A8LBA9_9SACH|nr:unnamed protein product [Kluyveromyces dobzhanskii CBS 2104]